MVAAVTNPLGPRLFTSRLSHVCAVVPLSNIGASPTPLLHRRSERVAAVPGVNARTTAACRSDLAYGILSRDDRPPLPRPRGVAAAIAGLATGCR